MIAAAMGRKHLFKLLLFAGADLFLANHIGRTAAQLAAGCAWFFTECVSSLKLKELHIEAPSPSLAMPVEVASASSREVSMVHTSHGNAYVLDGFFDEQ